MTTDRAQILLNGFDECMKHYRCGNYISMSDVEGLQEFLINEVNTQRL